MSVCEPYHEVNLLLRERLANRVDSAGREVLDKVIQRCPIAINLPGRRLCPSQLKIHRHLKYCDFLWHNSLLSEFVWGFAFNKQPYEERR